MIKTILLILLGLFFILNGLNHLFNRLTLEEYAHRRGLVSPRIMVLLSGLLLIFGGVSLMTGFFVWCRLNQAGENGNVTVIGSTH